MSFVDKKVQQLVEEIANILKSNNETLAISEAACGGILSAYIVSVPGALKFYQGSTLLYSLKLKLKLSGWTEEEISHYTGPSEASVKKQARNLKVELGSNYVLCESGFAGPGVTIEDASGDGHGTNKEEQKKVGIVYFAVSGPDGTNSIVRETGMSDRIANMEEFAKLGLEFLLQELKKSTR